MVQGPVFKVGRKNISLQKRVSISVINDLVTDQRLHRIAGTLERAGYRVLLTGRVTRRSLPFHHPSYGIRRFHMLFRKGPLFYAFYNIRLIIRLLLMKKPSLLVAVDLDTLPANFLVSHARKIPLLYDSHEYFTEVPELIGRRFAKGVWERIERAIVPKLEMAMTVSGSIASAYEEKYGTIFRVVRNVSELREPVKDEDFHDRYPARYKLIYQGALNLGRGIEQMITAMQYLDNTTLFVVGDGDIREELHLLAARLKLNDKVVFPGRIQPAQLHRLTCQCDAGLSLEADMGLSYRYALPNKIFDYIQARIPVICSDLPEMSHLVNSYQAGFVCAYREPEKLAARIREFLAGKSLCSPGKEMLDKAARQLCWEIEEKKLLEMVNELRGKKRR